MLKQGGKEVKEHNLFIEFQKFVASFEKKKSPWVSSDLINDLLQTVLQRRQNLECMENLSGTGDPSPDSFSKRRVKGCDFGQEASVQTLPKRFSIKMYRLGQ